MSPRHKVEASVQTPGAPTPPGPPRRWGLSLAVTIAAGVVAVAVLVCAAALRSHETQWRTSLNDAIAVSFVRVFMTDFTSPDPFHANDYVDRILAQATGDFAERYRRDENEILISVARSEPTTGTVLDVGISRRNDDGSVDVLAITKLTATSPDGKLQAERASRWVVTAKQEGDGWKISRLTPML